jgi:RNA polymerase sigma factor (sigma-70 family)
MMVESANVQHKLRRIVERLAPPALHDDLMQEALVHLWRAEERHPGQRESWYLQGCRFHLQNHLRQGRSVDSIKHHHAQTPNPASADDGTGLSSLPEPDGAFWEEISARDMIAALSRRLTPREKDTLLGFADGLTAREIGKRLGISHTLVNRFRQRIAASASELGISTSGA